MKAKVGILMGSESDLPIMEEASKVLKDLGVEHEVKVMSAHRSPRLVENYVSNAEANGLEVMIAGAGHAAHLPGVVAAFTPLPVIGVPISSSALSGVDSLYAIVQMPSGVPVATVAINGAKNAGILAAQILSVKYPEIRQKLKDFKKRMASDIEERIAGK